MGQRHNARCVVLEVLYSVEVGAADKIKANIEYCSNLHELADDAKEFASKLFEAVYNNIEAIDKILNEHIKNWDINRLAIVDKNVLRLGVGEIKYFPETPVKVAIDESIELAKNYGSADSGRFVNGVLDAICDEEELKG